MTQPASNATPSASIGSQSQDATEGMLPCPSCGETDVDATFATGIKGANREEHFYNAGCMICGMMGPDSNTPRDAADRWNALPRWSSVRSAIESRWIPVGERMPPEFVVGMHYLCWFQGREAVLEYDPQVGWLWGDGAAMIERVQAEITHWMPLPEAPK